MRSVGEEADVAPRQRAALGALNNARNRRLTPPGRFELRSIRRSADGKNLSPPKFAIRLGATGESQGDGCGKLAVALSEISVLRGRRDVLRALHLECVGSMIHIGID